jgi:septum formation protein
MRQNTIKINTTKEQQRSSNCGETKWFLRNAKSIKDAVFVLAGGSSDEISILNQIGIEPKVVNIGHEKLLPSSLPPNELVEEKSAAKAIKIVKILTEKKAVYDIIIGCESVIVLDSEIIGRPKDSDAALSILSRLNNRWHSSFTGVTLIHSSHRIIQFHVKTDIKFCDIPVEMYQEYVKSGEWFNQTGAYNIHGKGAAFIECLNGVLPGIPVCKLIQKICELLLPPESLASAVTSQISSMKHRPIPLPRTISLVSKLDSVNTDTNRTIETMKKNECYGAPCIYQPSVLNKSLKDSASNKSTVKEKEDIHKYATQLANFSCEKVIKKKEEETRPLNAALSKKEHRYTCIYATASGDESCEITIKEEEEDEEEFPKYYQNVQGYVRSTDFTNAYPVSEDHFNDVEITSDPFGLPKTPLELVTLPSLNSPNPSKTPFHASQVTLSFHHHQRRQNKEYGLESHRTMISAEELFESRQQHRPQPQSSQSVQHNFRQHLSPKDISTNYRGIGKPGSSNLHRMGIQPQLHPNYS